MIRLLTSYFKNTTISSLNHPPPKTGQKYTTPVVYHGGERDNSDKRHYYFSSCKHIARQFNNMGTSFYNKLHGVEKRQLRFQNPLVVDGKGHHWGVILFEDAYKSTNQLAELAFNHGHDGVIITDIVEGPSLNGETSTTYIRLKSPSKPAP